MAPGSLDVRAVRRHFTLDQTGRIATNNAASTQPPRELLALYQSLAPEYENVHRGQSTASQQMTALFEESYDTIAQFIGAPGRASIALYRNTTEAINAVMYSLLTEFRDGDNVVTTMMEHNSNYVPWYALCREILPRLGRRVEYRLARFDPDSGELDTDHLASLIDSRTKLVCCTGASNFLGTRNPLSAIRALADASGYRQPDGERRSYLLVDAAQLVPGSFVDVRSLDVDYLAFSFHKIMAPFGVGVLYARAHLLRSALPFLYGGDMIAEGRVFPWQVEYNALPWKYTAGTPNILGTIVSAQALRVLLDLALTPDRPAYFGTAARIGRATVYAAMDRVSRWNQQLTGRALDGLGGIGGITIYGPRDPARRTSLVAFNLAGRDPVSVAQALNQAGVESRAGCHCATLAHHALGLTPPASCRLSFYLYNTPDEVDHAVAAVAAVAAGRRMPAAPRRRFRSRLPGERSARRRAPVASAPPSWTPEERNADHPALHPLQEDHPALHPLQEEPSRVLG
ncbi:MAG: aminotransferase class V-fold PLP-dependent enzyme [Actinobacteria bacterium]|nr:aminotransferase class V-fold PLP-dependent enzyme [Actinomycetota bacterium]